MRVRSRIVVIAACAAALLVAWAASASASTFHSTVKVTQYSLGFFYGNVKSPQGKCKGKRHVSLFTVPSTPGEPSKLVGSDRTTKKGKWTINDSYGLGGSYQATVSAKGIKIKGKSHTCAEATSPVFTR